MYLLLALLGIGTIFAVFFAAEYDRRVSWKMLNEAIQYDAQRKASEKKKSESTVTELTYEDYPTFDSEYVPYCTESEDSYLNILRNYARYYRTNAGKNDCNREKNEWLQPALSELENQCDTMQFAVTTLQQLLQLMKEKGLTTITSESYGKVQKVIDLFAKNRAESVDLLLQIDDAVDKKLLKKLKATLLCLIKDNDEIFKGLDIFIAGIRNVLAKVCEDQNPDHITDFTSLHDLLEIPSMIDRVMAETKEKAEAEQQEVPTIEVPANRRVADYFTNMGLDTPTTDTEEESSQRGSLSSTN